MIALIICSRAFLVQVWRVEHSEMGTLAMKESESMKLDTDTSKRIVTELDVLKKAAICPHIVDYYAAFYKNASMCVNLSCPVIFISP